MYGYRALAGDERGRALGVHALSGPRVPVHPRPRHGQRHRRLHRPGRRRSPATSTPSALERRRRAASSWSKARHAGRDRRHRDPRGQRAGSGRSRATEASAVSPSIATVAVGGRGRADRGGALARAAASTARGRLIELFASLALALSPGSPADPIERLERAVAPVEAVRRRVEATIGELGSRRTDLGDRRQRARRGPLVLAFGCIHGDECAGIARGGARCAAAARRTAAAWSRSRTSTRTGSPSARRLNARGVDLNRNFAADWRPIGVPGDPGALRPAAVLGAGDAARAAS